MDDNQTPSEKLAAIILTRLCAENLILEEREESVRQKMERYSVSSSDWKLEFELSEQKTESIKNEQ